MGAAARLRDWLGESLQPPGSPAGCVWLRLLTLKSGCATAVGPPKKPQLVPTCASVIATPRGASSPRWASVR
jgi:hypothetical protein